MDKAALRLKLLKVIVPVTAHKGSKEVVSFAEELEQYVLAGSDKSIPGGPEKDPGDTGKDQGLITLSDKKVPKNKT